MYIATQQALSELIQDNLVNGRLSIRAVARLLELSDNKSLFIGEGFKSQKLAQILTSRGFKAEDFVAHKRCRLPLTKTSSSAYQSRI